MATILNVNRVQPTLIVNGCAGTGVTASFDFVKQPTAVLDDLLSVVSIPNGSFTALVFNLEQSTNSGGSWAVAATWDAVADPAANFQIAESILYRLNCTTFTPNTATSVNVDASTTGEDTLLATIQTANQVLASPNGASGFLSTRALVAADIPSLSASYDAAGAAATAQAAAEAASVPTVSAPSHYNSTGVAGQFSFDSTNIYFCLATNTWLQISSSGVFSTSF